MKASNFCFDPKHRKCGAIMCVKCQKPVDPGRDIYQDLNTPVKTYPSLKDYIVEKLSKNENK
jgi:hypothetical protein